MGGGGGGGRVGVTANTKIKLGHITANSKKFAVTVKPAKTLSETVNFSLGLKPFIRILTAVLSVTSLL